MRYLKYLTPLLIVFILSSNLISLAIESIEPQKNGVFIVSDIIEYLTLVPLALKLNYPILLEGQVSERTFLAYYPCSATLRINIKDFDNYLDFVFSKIICDTIVIVNTTDIQELTLISVYASRKVYPILLVNNQNELKAALQKIKNKSLICFGIKEQLLKELKATYKLADLDYFLKQLNTKVVHKDILAVGIIGDEFLPLIAYYAGARKCLVELFNLNELLASKKLSNIIKKYNIKKLVLVASLSSLKKSPGEGNLVNSIYKSAIEAYGDRYLKVSVGVLSGVTFSDALAFVMRNIFYDKLVGAWRSRLAAIYMSEGMALAKKILRIGTRANLTVDQVVSEKAKAEEYSNVVKILSSGSLITYINLHGNPVAMSPMEIGPTLLTGIQYGRAIPYTSPSIVLTFSCDTARFHEPYLKEPGESIALSFIARGAVAYVGAIALEFSSGIEIDTAHTELILTLLLQGKEIGDIIRIVNNLHIASNKDIKPHLAAYTVLLGDPLLRIKPLITTKLCLLKVIEPNKKYTIEVLAETPVIYLEIPVNVKSDDIKKVEVIDRNIASWSFVEKYGDKSLVCIFITRELSLEVGDFEPGDVIKVKVIIKESEWVIYLIPAIVVAIAIIIYLIERKKSRR